MHDTSNPLARVARSTADFIESAVQNMAGRKPRQEQTVYELPRPKQETGAYRTEGTLAQVQQATPLSEAGKRELRMSFVAPPAPLFDHTAAHPTPELFAAVAPELELKLGLQVVGDIITQREIDEIFGFDLDWQRRCQTELLLTPDAARRDCQMALEGHGRKVSEGGAAAVSGDVFSLTEWQEDYAARQRLNKAAKVKDEVQAAAVARAPRLRMGAAVLQLADHEEAKGRERSAIYLCDYAPTTEVKMLRRMAAELLDPNQGLRGRPAHMIAFAGIPTPLRDETL